LFPRAPLVGRREEHGPIVDGDEDVIDDGYVPSPGVVAGRRRDRLRRGALRRTRSTEGGGPVGPSVAESEAAAAAAVLSGRDRIRRKTVCSNRRNRQRVQVLDCR